MVTDVVETPVRLRAVWKEALALWAPTFKRGWSWFFFSQGVEVLASLCTSFLQKLKESSVILGVGVVVIVQLVMVIFSLIIVNTIIDDVKSGVPKTHLLPAFKENLKYTFVNFARALLKTSLGFILFVVPGFVFWIRYSFVPYVVLFDPEFKKGRVDALEASQTLVHGRFWRVAGILILSTVLSMVPGVWLSSISPVERPFAFALIFLAGMWLELYGDVVTYCLYRKIT